jgi:hypothetical protein
MWRYPAGSGIVEYKGREKGVFHKRIRRYPLSLKLPCMSRQEANKIILEKPTYIIRFIIAASDLKKLSAQRAFAGRFKTRMKSLPGQVFGITRH